jgi:curved DNA-binding protein CbpA
MDRGTKHDHYTILGVRRSATQVEIKKAYRIMAKRFHPDHDGSPAATRSFLAAHAAYEVLRDPIQRLAYDASLRAPHRDPAYKPHPKPRPAAPVQEKEMPDMNTRHWAFFGLHLTGLVFGIVLVLGLTAGIAWRDWPLPAAFFAIPGLVVIPDAWGGLRLWYGRRVRN